MPIQNSLVGQILNYQFSSFHSFFFNFLLSNTTKVLENPSFQKYKKALQQNAKGLEIVRLPLWDAFRTFKGNITTENIRLNQLILQY